MAHVKKGPGLPAMVQGTGSKSLTLLYFHENGRQSAFHLSPQSSFHTHALLFFLVMLTPGHGKGGGGLQQPPLFLCQTCFCLSFCPDGSSVTSAPLRGQIGGCEEANVISAALGGGNGWIYLQSLPTQPSGERWHHSSGKGPSLLHFSK